MLHAWHLHLPAWPAAATAKRIMRQFRIHWCSGHGIPKLLICPSPSPADVLHEGFGALQLGGSSGGPESSDACRRQAVHLVAWRAAGWKPCREMQAIPSSDRAVAWSCCISACKQADTALPSTPDRRPRWHASTACTRTVLLSVPGAAQRAHQALHQRLFRPHHHEVNALFPAEGNDLCWKRSQAGNMWAGSKAGMPFVIP